MRARNAVPMSLSPASASEGFQRASGKSFGAPTGAYPLSRQGLTRRLRRGLGLAVPWGAHTFLSMAKEKCAKESQRHGDYGKKPLIAHFAGGARYVARTLIGKISLAIVRAPNSPFSLRCLSPLRSPTGGAGQTQRNASWDVSAWLEWLRSAKKRTSFFLYSWHCTYSTNGAGMIRCCLDIFATQKASMVSYPRWPFMRAMRPVAEWRSFLFNWRFPTPDPRAARPVAERR